MLKLKNIFKSRFGDEGVIIECDWSSLEIVGWAFLSKDPMLYKMIREGRDMHRMVGSLVLNKPSEEISDAERKALKPANFEFIYGGTGYNQIRNGADQEFIESAYEAFWTLFPVARQWGDNLMKLLDINAYSIKEYSPKGAQIMESWYQGVTGRKFFFKNYPDKISSFCAEKRLYTPKGFKYSEGMNYQVQSFCTADIHMIALGILFREAQYHRDKFLLINTVHDSVLVDCRKKYIDFACNLIKNSLESVVDRLKEKFNIVFDLPLKVEVEIGPSWGEVQSVK